MRNRTCRRCKTQIAAKRLLFEQLEDRKLLANWSGDIPNGTVWTNDELQRIEGDVRVPPGATLTIQPGALVKVDTGNAVRLVVEGRILAQGTDNQPILVTSMRDDTGADGLTGTADDRDSNNDGPSAGEKGDWGGIAIEPSSTGSVFEHFEIRYAGGSGNAAILVNEGDLDFRNGAVRDSFSHGVRIVSSSPRLEGLTFVDNLLDAISMDLASHPSITNITFVNNRTNGVAVDSGELPSDTTWDNPDVVYHLSDGITVPLGRTLTVAAGQIVKPGGFGPDITVAGRLLVNGTAEQPVIFTSPRDDSAGGDTTNDGDAEIFDWGAINFTETSTGSVLNHADIRFGGATGNQSVLVDGGELTMRDSTIRNSRTNGLEVRNRAVTISGSTFHDNGLRGLLLINSDATLSNNNFSDNATIGLRIENSKPLLTGNRFENNQDAALSMDLASDPNITGVSLTNNGVNGLLVDSGILPGDVTWDDPEIVYALNKDFNSHTVPAGSTLTIGAGQILKGGLADMIVDGRLLVNGTAERPVIITSPKDDSAGGDTNNDGGPSFESRSNWTGLRFNPTSAGSVITHAEVRFGGGVDFDGQLYVDSADLTVRNSVIRSGGAAGIYTRGTANLVVENSILVDNFPEFGASGIRADGGFVRAVNNTIDANARGITAIGASVTLINNLITFHTELGVTLLEGATLDARFNNVFNPDAEFGNYKGLANQTGLNGNTSADPKYFNPANFQYHLRAGSPVIDAATSDGAPATDFLNNPRFDDPHVINRGGGAIPFVDMGGLERQETSPPSGIDLIAADIRGPATGLQDDVVTVDWTVENVGTNSATGSWQDAVYLSVDPIWTPDDLFLGEALHTGDLGPGQSYVGSATVTLPGVLPGDYYFLVRANSSLEIFEGSALGNNTGASSDTIATDLPELVLGTPLAGRLTATGETKLYKVQAAAGNDLGIELTGPDGASNELYLQFGDVPSRQFFDARGIVAQSAKQTAAVGSARAGTYFVMVFGANLQAPEDFTLTASLSDFSITSVSPARASNTGQVTLTMEGAKFDDNSRPRLIDSTGAPLDPIAVYFTNSRQIAATFDLTGRPIGPADIQVINAGNVTTTLPDSLDVFTGQPGRLVANLTTTDPVRVGRDITITVEYANDGDTDLQAPLLQLVCDPEILIRMDRGDTGGDPSLALIAVNPSGPAGVLPPGASGRLTFYARAEDQTYTFKLFETKFPAAPIDWAALESQIRPADIADAEWAPIFGALQSNIGIDWANYHRIIAEDTSLLPAGRGSNHLLRDVFQLEIDKARAALFPSISGHLRLGDTDRPLGSVPIQLYDPLQNRSAVAISQTDGSFLVPQVLPGTYAISLLGFVPAAATSLTFGTEDLDGLEILADDAAAIAGAIATPEGIPLRDMLVTAVGDDGTSYFGRTDNDGRYVIDSLPGGAYDLIAGGGTRVQAVAMDVTVAAAEVRAHVNFVLELGQELGGIVSGPGGPVADALVTVVPMAPPEGTVAESLLPAPLFLSLRGLTSATGSYQFTGLAPGFYSVTVSHTDFEDAQRDIEIVRGAGPTMLDVELTTAGRLRGTVTQGVGGAVVPFASILLEREEKTLTAQTDAQGEFSLDRIPAGTYRLSVGEANLMSVALEVDVIAGALTEVDLVTGTQGTIRGRATDRESGQGISHVFVHARSPQGLTDVAVTDDLGNYELAGLDSGTYLVVLGDAFTAGAASTIVTLSPTAPTAEANFTADVVATLRGRVLAADGVTPVASALVTLSSDESPILSASTDEQGHYSFVVLQEGTFRLLSAHTEFVYQGQEVDVQRGTEPPAAIDFVAGAASIPVSVREAVTGVAVAGATVLFSRVDEPVPARIGPERQTDADGRARLDNAVPGRYEVRVIAPGLAAAAQLVDVAGEPLTDVAFLLPAESRLVGTITDATTQLPLANARIVVANAATLEVLALATTDDEGDFVVEGLDAGNLDITVRASGHVTGRTQISLATQETRPIALDVEESSIQVSGEVRNEAGPVSKAAVTILDADGRLVAQAYTDDDGRYLVNELAPGDYQITAAANGQSPSDPALLTVAAGESTTHDVTLAAAALTDPEDKPGASEQDFGWFAKIVVPPVRRHPSVDDLPPYDSTLAGCMSNRAELVSLIAEAEAFYIVWSQVRAPEALSGLDELVRHLQRIEQANDEALAFALMHRDLLPLRPVGTAEIDYNLLSRDVARVIQLARQFPPDRRTDEAKMLNFNWDLLIRTRAAVPTLPDFIEEVASLADEVAFRNGDLRSAEIDQRYEDTLTIAKLYQTVLIRLRKLREPMQPIGQYFVDEAKYQALVAKIQANLAGLEGSESKSQKLVASNQSSKANLLGQTCKLLEKKLEPPQLIPDKQLSESRTETERSFDPNDKIGPSGFGTDRFTQPGTFSYEILFENDPNAGATIPAQEVFITDTLDEDLDLSTLEFVAFGFNNRTFDVPAGLAFYETTVDLRPDAIDLLVPVRLEVDAKTRQLIVAFRSLDPLTRLLPDALDAGFLPVNDKAQHNGEGFIRYRIRAKAGQASGTEIINQASIVFDINDPILTPVARNTLDVGDPTSSVKSLPAVTTSTSFPVSWSGSDDAGGSGIANYDVYVSTDDGPFELWLGDTTTTTTSDTYVGQLGHRYAFYSIATDNVGHVELPPATFDAITEVMAAPWQSPTHPFDVNADSFIVPLDVLLIVNELNAPLYHDSTGVLQLPPPAQIPGYYDVNADGFVVPLDVLLVINYLNSQGAGPVPEGESLTSGEGEHVGAESAPNCLCVPVSLDRRRLATTGTSRSSTTQTASRNVSSISNDPRGFVVSQRWTHQELPQPNADLLTALDSLFKDEQPLSEDLTNTLENIAADVHRHRWS